MTSLLRRLVAMIFGYDYFISYSWSDGGYYATELARRLRQQGFECFLDSTNVIRGDNWRLAGRIALAHTARLLLVCSPGILGSESVAYEVRTFQRTKRRIIPIDLGATLESAPRSNQLRQLIDDDVISVRENISRLNCGPSELVIGDLHASFNLARQAQKRQQWLAATVVLLFAVAMTATVGFWRAERQRKDALSRALAAQALVESGRQFDLALLLAAEANRVQTTRGSRSALLEILERAPVEYYLHGKTPVGVVAVSPADPNLIITAEWNGTLRAWDLASRQLVASIASGDERIETLAFRPDGVLLASDGQGDEVILWNAVEGLTRNRVLKMGRGRRVREVVYLDDDRLLVAMDNGPLTVVDLKTGRRDVLPDVHDATPTVLTVDKLGRVLATAGSDNRIAVWDLAPEGPQHRRTFHLGDWILALDFDPSSRFLVAGGHDGGVVLLDTESDGRTPIPPAGSDGRVFGVAFVASANGGLEIVWAGDYEMGRFRLRDQLMQRWAVHRDTVLDLAWEPERGRVVTAGRDGKVAVLSMGSVGTMAEQLGEFDSPGGWITASVDGADGRLRVVGDEGGDLYVVDIETGQISEGVHGHEGRVRDLTYSELANSMVSIGDDSVIRWWSLEDRKLHNIASLVLSGTGLECAVAVPDSEAVLVLTSGGRLLMVGNGAVARFWGDFTVGEVSARERMVLEAQADGGWVVAGVGRRLVSLDVATGRRRWEHEMDEMVGAVAIDAEGNRVLIGSGTVIEVRSGDDGRLQGEIQVGRLPVAAMSVGRENGLVASVDTAANLTLWDLEEQAQVGPSYALGVHDVAEVGFGEGGSSLLALGRTYRDGVNRYSFVRWMMEATGWEEAARRRANRRMSAIEMERFGLER